MKETSKQIRQDYKQDYKQDYCSLCGRIINKKEPAVVGGDGTVYICSDCLDDLKTVKFSTREKNVEETKSFPTPHKIYEFLNQYVIGQESAKKTLSVAVYNHYKRLFSKYNKNEVELEKSNIILLGPSGSGKTLLCKTIARMLDVPFVIADATSVTESGYVGEDVESILSKLLQASDYNIERAEQGIVFIDEIDKIGTKRGSANITRDVSGEGVQQALLKMIEGTIVNCPPNGGRIHPEQKLVPIDTTNILFICSGAFVGIEQEVEKRHNKHAVGFISGRTNEDNNKDPLNDINATDLRAFGLIPELIGRLPIIAHTTELSKEQLYQVLTEPKNAIIKQYKTLLNIDNKELEFDKNALKYIVELAIKSEVGARGLRGILEKVMEQYMFDAPDTDIEKITVTKKNIKKILEAA